MQRGHQSHGIDKSSVVPRHDQKMTWRGTAYFGESNVALTMTMCIVKINSNDHRSSPISASEHVAKRKEKRNPADCLAGQGPGWMAGL
jgi:hypothetical protein